ncbi:MAG: GAF domain-containing sensor histidine kinase [Bacteroidetes bacterium]|nr:GAF domain-containing sensor histidine kinase [Bacteroidota bacterium]
MKNSDHERERLRILEMYSIVDTPPEEEYDNIAQIASEISHSPMAQINIIDATKQYSKSSLGIPRNVLPREFAFCNHTVQNPFAMTIVPDMRLDERFQNHPGVVGEPYIQFYTGVPLTTAEGFALGSLCVMDIHPKELNSSQLETLRALAAQVVVNLELRRNNLILKERQQELKSKYDELEQFAFVVSHDLKSPLNNIIALAKMLKQEYGKQLDTSGLELVEYLNSSSGRLKSLIEGILEFYRGDQILANHKEEIELNKFLHDISKLNNPLNDVQFKYPEEPVRLRVNKVVLEQIFLNLFVNAIKYNDKEKTIISVSCTQDDQLYYFTVQDNGIGIDEAHLLDIFRLFTNLNKKDKHGNLGTGIGLSTVKKLVEKSGGNIRVSSKPGIGTSFLFSIKK